MPFLHPCSKKLRELSEVDLIPYDADFNIDFTECAESDENSIVKIKQQSAQPNPEIIKKLHEEISFAYDNKLSKTPAKLTVSEISKKESAHEISLRRPSFIAEKKALSGSEKGVALHTFMQCADFEKASQNVKNEIERLVNGGYLTKNQGSAFDIEKIEIFFRSQLYIRIKNAKNVCRERKFLMKISDLKLTDELGKEYEGTDGMLQGIADCIFEEDDGLVLIDYKTDYVKDKSELIDDYSRQLELYKLALDKLYTKQIKEILIYSFKLNEEISLCPTDLH